MCTEMENRPQLQGQRLRELRKQKGLSAEKLARLSDVSTRQIWRLEGNTRPNSAAITVARVAEALDTTLEYLLGMTNSPSVPLVFQQEARREIDR